jgi:dihydroxy-acid dehydratase
LNALAAHMGVQLSLDDWQRYGEDVPLLVNMQPAGEYLGEDYYRAGGVPAVIAQLMSRDLIRTHAKTVTGRTIGELCANAKIEDQAVIRPIDKPLAERAGFVVMRGNLFNSAIMKTSVISPEFRERYLSNPSDPDAFEGTAVVFDGPEDYHARIDDPALGITEQSILFMRGCGPIGYPGSAEVVNMRPPDYLLRKGVRQLPCVGDGRQSGTSGSPSILNASPEAAAGGGLALLRTGDRVRVDLRKARLDVLVPAEEVDRRRMNLEREGGYRYPPSQTPWQEIQRKLVGQLEDGAVLTDALEFQKIAQTRGIPRDNH